MESIGFSLALASVFFFLAALGFSTKPVKAAEKKLKDANNTDEQKFILVKFPKDNLFPGNYTLDLKITVSGGKKWANEKTAGDGQSEKKLYRRLDEYM